MLYALDTEFRIYIIVLDWSVYSDRETSARENVANRIIGSTLHSLSSNKMIHPYL